MHKIIFILMLVTLSLCAKPSDYEEYYQKVGSHYNIPPLLLKNIVRIESGGNPNAIRKNDNGTKDYGLMQINSIHFSRLRQWGINENNIMNPQINIFVGGWLLSEHIKDRGFNLQAIGNYHSKTDVYREQWLKKLIIALKTPS